MKLGHREKIENEEEEGAGLVNELSQFPDDGMLVDYRCMDSC
jgi:hypothetical protein